MHGGGVEGSGKVAAKEEARCGGRELELVTTQSLVVARRINNTHFRRMVGSWGSRAKTGSW